MPQITGRMTSPERKRFAIYASKLKLGGGIVATLLIIREMRARRLGALKSDPLLQPIGPISGKITTRRLNEAEKVAFRTHVSEFDLKLSRALGLLCRAELAEGWLEAALYTDYFDSLRVET
jgi:hypothetical protein